MKHVQVLGTGCAACRTTAARIEEAAARLGVTLALSKEEDLAVIAAFGVMQTPAVVVDGRLVHAGSVPEPEAIATWLA